MKDGSRDPQKPMFYGRRRNHKLRSGRQVLINDLLPKIRIAEIEDTSQIDLSASFGRAAKDVRLEIGFGAGEHLSGDALANPDIDFIGCEPFINGVAALLADVERLELTNIRLFDDDARLLLERLPAACISKIYVLFPDPWPKLRHNRRRFINQETLSSLSRVAKNDAEFIFASDHMGYVSWALVEMQRHADWKWTAKGSSDWRQQPKDWVPTRYETKALGKGDAPAYLTFRRQNHETD